jgi:signal transduction histidine kinase
MAEADLAIMIVISTLILLLLVAGIAISFLVINRQRSTQQMELAQARVSYEQELRRIEGEVAEQLMEQFARELHDNIGHLLTCIRLEVENKKLDHPTFEPMLRPLETYLDEATGQLRLLSRSLNTEYVSHIGLVSAIGLEAERQRQLKKFAVEWNYEEGALMLDKNQQLIIFRMLQEIFQNAIRHSKAKHLQIKLIAQPFLLEVRDDGKGFEVASVLAGSKASGLKNILRRCELADLHCQLETAPGQGCTYTLTKRTHD